MLPILCEHIENNVTQKAIILHIFVFSFRML